MATIVVHLVIEEAPDEPSRQVECIRRHCQHLTDWIRGTPHYRKVTLDVYDPEFRSHGQTRVRAIDSEAQRETLRTLIGDAQRRRRN